MVRGQDIRTAFKAVTDWGSWANGGMTTASFPLSKRQRKSYRLGTAYRWRVVRFEAGTSPSVTNCRLLIAYNLAKEQYRATLAVENGQDLSVIASYEYHGTHPGWHMHGACGDVQKIPTGSMRGAWQRRIPLPRLRHRRDTFNVSNDDVALDVAARFFRLHRKEGAFV